MTDAVNLSSTASPTVGVRHAPAWFSREAQAHIYLSIISNSCLLRDGVITLLSQHLNFQLVGSYRDAYLDTADLPSPQNHIVLIDDNIGRVATLNWLQYWRSRIPAATVLILHLADNPERIIEYIEHGASGYLLQNATAAEVATTVLQLYNGGTSCSPEVTAHLFARLAHLHTLLGEQRHSSPLTEREMEVLEALAHQMTNRQIADRLVIEVRTVKHHVHNILKKLNQSGRREAVRYAREVGWLGNK